MSDRRVDAMSDTEYAPSPWEPVADHVERYLATDGVDGFEFNGAECIILTTIGRKSGMVRRSPLIRVHDGEFYLVVASMGGPAGGVLLLFCFLLYTIESKCQFPI